MRHIPLPMAIDYESIAKGLLEMFTMQELAILRVGMLPAKKMEVLENTLKKKILEEYCTHKADTEGDYLFLYREKGGESVQSVKFNPFTVARDIAHNVSLEIYKHGNLVV